MERDVTKIILKSNFLKFPIHGIYLKELPHGKIMELKKISYSQGKEGFGHWKASCGMLG